MRKIIVIAHDIRSTHNVGSLLRTAEGLGLERVYFSGYTPYPVAEKDPRLPHVAEKITKQIQKTALGAETTQPWTAVENIEQLITSLREDGYVICALEQHQNAIQLPDFVAPERVVLLLGREVEGLQPQIMQLCDEFLEIPMFGKKESFNVVQAAAMAFFHLRFS